MHHPDPPAGAMTWVVRVILALAALAAPVLVYRGFTDPDVPDPASQQRLREASRPEPVAQPQRP